LSPAQSTWQGGAAHGNVQLWPAPQKQLPPKHGGGSSSEQPAPSASSSQALVKKLALIRRATLTTSSGKIELEETFAVENL